MFFRTGSASATPGVARSARAARASKSVPPVETWTSSRWSPQDVRVPSVAARASASVASRLATASATIAAVARLRRLRRPALRSPSCIAGGRKAMRRSARSAAPCPLTAEPLASSASRRSTCRPRRIAGSAASGGASSPAAMLTSTTPGATPKPTSIAQNCRPNERASRFASPIPSSVPASAPRTPSSSAVRV